MIDTIKGTLLFASFIREEIEFFSKSDNAEIIINGINPNSMHISSPYIFYPITMSLTITFNNKINLKDIINLYENIIPTSIFSDEYFISQNSELVINNLYIENMSFPSNHGIQNIVYLTNGKLILNNATIKHIEINLASSYNPFFFRSPSVEIYDSVFSDIFTNIYFIGIKDGNFTFKYCYVNSINLVELTDFIYIGNINHVFINNVVFNNSFNLNHISSLIYF